MKRLILFFGLALFGLAAYARPAAPEKIAHYEASGTVLAMAAASISIPKDRAVVLRFSDSGNDTLGLFFLKGEFQHFTVEDEFREIKIPGETRISAGVYPLKITTIGTHHEQYKIKFPQMHKGMVLIDKVPNFSRILYHIGNTDQDTEGCLLPGDSAGNNISGRGKVEASTAAYIRTYPKLVNYIQSDPNACIEYIDLDRALLV